PSGAITEFPLSYSRSPGDIVLGPDGNLWFAALQGAGIGRMTPSGVLTEFGIPERGYAVVGIAAAPDGSLWFLAFDHDKIGRVTVDGVFSELWVGLPGAEFSGIDAGPDGNVWLTDPHNRGIVRTTT